MKTKLPLVAGDRSSQMTPRERITALFGKCFDQGIVPWRKIHAGGQPPRKLSTGSNYAGMNSIILHASALANGYESALWVTEKQLAALGGRLLPGQRSRFSFVTMMAWRDTQSQRDYGIKELLDRARDDGIIPGSAEPLDEEPRRELSDKLGVPDMAGKIGSEEEEWAKGLNELNALEPEIKTLVLKGKQPVLGTIPVWNVDQTEKLEKNRFVAAEIEQRRAAKERNLAESATIAEGLGKSLCQVRHDPKADHPSYDPQADVITMPPRTAFPDHESFYFALFHQFAHAAGHPKRLGNQEWVRRCHDETFAELSQAEQGKILAEAELIAELCAWQMCHNCGLTLNMGNTDLAMNDLGLSADNYLVFWKTAVPILPNIFTRASREACSIANYLTSGDLQSYQNNYHEKNRRLADERRAQAPARRQGKGESAGNRNETSVATLPRFRDETPAAPPGDIDLSGVKPAASGLSVVATVPVDVTAPRPSTPPPAPIPILTPAASVAPSSPAPVPAVAPSSQPAPSPSSSSTSVIGTPAIPTVKPRLVIAGGLRPPASPPPPAAASRGAVPLPPSSPARSGLNRSV